MSNKILLALLALFAFHGTAVAEHHESSEASPEMMKMMKKPPLSIYGDFAGSVTFQGNEDDGTTFPGQPHDDFQLDLVEVNLEKNWSKSKVHLSIGYGNTPALFNSTVTSTTVTDSNNDTVTVGSPKPSLNLLNGYYQMDCNCGFSFKLGKFESFMGYESWNHMDNMQYNRSWGYALVPYFHTGLGLHYNFNKMATVSLYAVNDVEALDTDDNQNMNLALTVEVTAVENLAVDLKYLTGVDNAANVGGGAPANVLVNVDATTLELTAAYKFNDMFDAALDYTSRTTQAKLTGAQELQASSIAAYLNAAFGIYGAGLRYEMFSYDNGITIGNYNTSFGGVGEDNSINAITLAISAMIDQNAKVQFEYQTNSSDDQIWTDKDNNATDSMDSMTLSLMYRY